MNEQNAQHAVRDFAAAEMDAFWRENPDLVPDGPDHRNAAIDRFARQLITASGGVGLPDEVLAMMPEIARYNDPQPSPQQYDCGCIAVTRITDRDRRMNDRPFELRLAIRCDGASCSRREILMHADPSGRPKAKACIKCDGPITTPLLGDDDERCVHCADYDPHDPDSAERDERDECNARDVIDDAVDDHDRCVDHAIARGLITKTFRDSAADRRALDARERRAKQAAR